MITNMIISLQKIDDLESYKIVLECLDSAMKVYEQKKDPALLKKIIEVYEQNENFRKEIETKKYVT